MNWKLFKFIGLGLLLISGFPVLNRSPDSHRWAHKLLVGVGLFSHVFAIATAFTIDLTPVSSMGHTYAARSFIKGAWQMSVFGSLLTFIFALKQWSKIKGHIADSNSVGEKLASYELQSTKRKILTYLGISVLASFVVFFADMKIYFANVALGIESVEGINALAVIAAVSVVLLPTYLHFWSSYYNLTLGYLLELEAIEKLSEMLLTPPLPAEEDETPFMSLFGPRVLYHASAPDLHLPYSYKYILRTLAQIKRARLNLNNLYYFSVTWALLVGSCYYPITIINFIFRRKVENTSPLNQIYLFVVLVLSTVVQFSPLCVNQIIKYRKECLIRKAVKEFYNTADDERKKTFRKVVASLKDPFPDSPFVLLDLDTSLLPILVDAMVLMVTSFIAK